MRKDIFQLLMALFRV